MPRCVDLVGRQFGDWHVLSLSGRRQYGESTELYWMCVCKCGVKREVNGPSLKKKLSTGCGCGKAEKARKAAFKHGLTGSRTHNSWVSTRRRCYDKKCRAYYRYGGRGIFMCKRWRDSASAFRDDMGVRPIGKTIDRINNAGGYWCGKPVCPECGPMRRVPNCRWATPTEQSLNTRRNHWITIDGVRKALCQWAEESPVTHAQILNRLAKGMSPKEAVKTGDVNSSYHTYKGELYSTAELADKAGISTVTFRGRLRRDWTVEEAVETKLGVQLKPCEKRKRRQQTLKTYTYHGETLTVFEWSVKLGIPRGTLRARLHKKWDYGKVFSSEGYRPRKKRK